MPQPKPHAGRHWVNEEHVDSRTAAADALGRACANVEAVLYGQDFLRVLCLICSPLTRKFVEPQLLDWARSHVDALDLTDHERDQLCHMLSLVPNFPPADFLLPSTSQDPIP